ncbi:MAG: sugar phosphate nucleotidyltransferase [Nanoarchaeota archaeon]
MEITEAIIPCAGRGERMGSFTDEIPKPMITFGGIPFLQFVIYHLNQAGIERFIIPVGYKGEKIKDYFGDGSDFGIEIEYVQSSVEAESGGSFMRGLKILKGDSCLMHYGDAFFPTDLRPALEDFAKSDKKGMVIASKRYTLEGFADKNNLEVDKNNNVIAYGEGNPNAKYLDVGLALFRKEVLNDIEGDHFKLASILFPKLIDENELLVFGTEIKSIGIGNIEKIGRFNNYLKTNNLLEKVKAMKKE